MSRQLVCEYSVNVNVWVMQCYVSSCDDNGITVSRKCTQFLLFACMCLFLTLFFRRGFVRVCTRACTLVSTHASSFCFCLWWTKSIPYSKSIFLFIFPFLALHVKLWQEQNNWLSKHMIENNCQKSLANFSWTHKRISILFFFFLCDFCIRSCFFWYSRTNT